MNMQSSHKLYIVLNENDTLYWDKNRDYCLYKTKEELEKYVGKKIAIFTLTDVQKIEEVLMKK